MKLRSAKHNNRKKGFEVCTRSGKTYFFPYAKAEPTPTAGDRVCEVFVDPELGREGFTYVLESGSEGSVHLDHILEYNEDPATIRDLLVYKLTLEAQKRVKASSLSTREIIRRLGTSPAQFYRLLDQRNRRKSLGQLVSLLHILDCEVDLVVRRKPTD